MTAVDRIEAMRAFVAVVEAQGFAQAARRLSMSAPAVTRAVSALETRIGARLLHRTTRALRLTESGGRFFDDCKRILAAIEAAESSATCSHREARGQLSITAPLMFGRLHVAPIVLDFLNLNPQLSARMYFVDQVIDLMENAVDVAIRIGRLPESSLRAIRIGSVRPVVCASPAYLARHAAPQRPAELPSHRLVGFAGRSPLRHWSFLERGKPVKVAIAPRILVNTADLAIAAAVAGHGVTRVLSYQVAAELLAGTLVLLLAEHELPASPIHIVHAEGARATTRVRAFVDFAVERLKRAVPRLPR
jgi:DNA-binding transcriptional LysR family regulator